MTTHEKSVEAVSCAICGDHHDANTIWIVENTDGKFVASFSTHLLAHYFVEEGSGCYRHRAALPAPSDQAKLIGEYRDLISDALTDSLEIDWQAGDGASAVIRCLAENGLAIVPRRATRSMVNAADSAADASEAWGLMVPASEGQNVH